MSQVVSIRLSDDLVTEFEKRAKSQGETLGIFIQEALRKLVEDKQNEPARAAPTPKDIATVEVMKELLFIHASLYHIAEHAQGGAFIPKDLLTKIYEAAKQGSQQKIDARMNGDAVMRGSVGIKSPKK